MQGKQRYTKPKNLSILVKTNAKETDGKGISLYSQR
jgi:hypothetical protein